MPMNIFGKNRYEQVLRELVEERKNLDPENNFQRLAEAIRVPKSYLSKVLHGKAQLSADQLHLACQHLQLSNEEGDYLHLLLEASRTGLVERRMRLESQIEQKQREHAKAEKYLTAPVANGDLMHGRAEYFLDPWAAIVHMALLIPRFRSDLSLLSRQLGITRAKLNATVTNLERQRFIERRRGEITVLIDHLHLPSVSSIYRAWSRSLSSLGEARLDSIDEGDAYTFSVVFSADKSAAQAIRLKILEVLTDVESAVKAAPSEEVYQMEINLFPWTGR